MSETTFDVVVPTFSSSIEEWQRAQTAPKSELPKLTDEQKDVARKFKISEEEYARGVLSGRYGQARMKERAKWLGDHVQSLLDELGSGDHVNAVVYEMDRVRWIVSIQTAEGTLNIDVPRELADDIVDWGLKEQLQVLRARLVHGLGRRETSTTS